MRSAEKFQRAKAELLDLHILQVLVFTAALVDVNSRRGKSTSRIHSREVARIDP